jgi:U3 small nucleolar RNA-associated protein 13
MLKGSNDGLSKAWKHTTCHQPYFDGGKVRGVYLIPMLVFDTEVIVSVFVFVMYPQVQVSLNERIFASLYNENVTFMDWTTGAKIFTLFDEEVDEDGESTNDVVTCFALHPQATHVAISTRQNLLQLWSIDAQTPSSGSGSKACMRSIRGHVMPVLSMCFDPTGSLVATGSADCSVRVWDLFNGYCTHSFRDLHKDIVQRVYFHPVPNNMTLFSTSEDSSIRIFDLTTQKCVATHKDHMSLPSTVSVTSDGKLLVSGGRDKVRDFCIRSTTTMLTRMFCVCRRC